MSFLRILILISIIGENLLFLLLFTLFASAQYDPFYIDSKIEFTSEYVNFEEPFWIDF
jgi:hypothetical protein